MSEKLLASTMTAAIAIETIGAVDPFDGGKVLLPSPRRYLAVWLLWFIFDLIADAGPRAARLAGAFSVLVVTTMVVVGPFGSKLVHFINRSSALFPAEGGAA